MLIKLQNLRNIINQNTILHLRKLSEKSYFQLTKAKTKKNSRCKSKNILKIKCRRHLQKGKLFVQSRPTSTIKHYKSRKQISH